MTPTSPSTWPPSASCGAATRSASHRPNGRSSRSSSATPAASSRSGSCCRRCGDRSTATETNYLRVYMAQIRRKLEPDPARPRYFVTEPGMGYRFEPFEAS